jgi:hypothetical protein
MELASWSLFSKVTSKERRESVFWSRGGKYCSDEVTQGVTASRNPTNRWKNEISDTQSMSSRPVAPAPLGIILEMSILRSHPSPGLLY